MTSGVKGPGFKEPIQPKEPKSNKSQQKKQEQSYYISPELLKKKIEPNETPRKESQKVTKQSTVDTGLVKEAATQVIQPALTKKKRSLSPTQEVQIKRSKVKGPERQHEVKPGGMVNSGRNVCYSNSLVNALRKSNWFRDQIAQTTPGVITRKSIQEIQKIVDVKYAEDLDLNGELNMEIFLNLPPKVRSNLLDELSPNAKQELDSVLREHFSKVMGEIFKTLDDGKTATDTQVDDLRIIARSLGWRNFEPANKQQDSQEYLLYIFESILHLNECRWSVVNNYALEMEVFSLRPRPDNGHFISLAVPNGQTDIDQLFNNFKTREPFDPEDHLFNHIVDKYKNPKTSADFATISEELQKLFDTLLKLDTKEFDATLQLLLNSDILNLTPQSWEKIKNGAKYNYYEKQLTNEIESFVKLQKLDQKSRNHRIDELEKLGSKCEDIRDTDAFDIFADILEGAQQIKSSEAIDNIGSISKKQIAKDISNKIADITSNGIKALQELHKNLAGMQYLEEEDKAILECLDQNLSSSKKQFNIHGIKDGLKEIEEKFKEQGLLNNLKLPGTAYYQLTSDLKNLDKIEELKAVEKELRDFFDKLQNLKDDPEEFKKLCRKFSDIAIPDKELRAQYSAAVKKLEQDIDGNEWLKGKFGLLARELQILQDKHKTLEVETSKQHVLETAIPPQLLPISLKRYVQKIHDGNVVFDRRSDPVSPSPTIRVKLPGDNDEYAEYTLKSVVVHVGSDPYSGHYFTYTPQPDGMWMEHNDETVRLVDPENNSFDCDTTIKKKGYLYLYEYTGKA